MMPKSKRPQQSDEDFTAPVRDSVFDPHSSFDFEDDLNHPDNNMSFNNPDGQAQQSEQDEQNMQNLDFGLGML